MPRPDFAQLPRATPPLGFLRPTETVAVARCTHAQHLLSNHAPAVRLVSSSMADWWSR